MEELSGVAQFPPPLLLLGTVHVDLSLYATGFFKDRPLTSKARLFLAAGP